MNREALLRNLYADTGQAPDGPRAPHIASLTLRFQLYGCESLKQKKRIFQPLRSLLGRDPDLAVAEVDDQDSLDRATWSIVAVGDSPSRLQSRLQQAESLVTERIDAPVLDVRYESA